VGLDFGAGGGDLADVVAKFVADCDRAYARHFEAAAVEGGAELGDVEARFRDIPTPWRDRIPPFVLVEPPVMEGEALARLVVGEGSFAREYNDLHLPVRSIAVIGGVVGAGFGAAMRAHGFEVTLYVASTASRAAVAGDEAFPQGGFVVEAGGHFDVIGALTRSQIDMVTRELTQAQQLAWRYADRLYRARSRRHATAVASGDAPARSDGRVLLADRVSTLQLIGEVYTAARVQLAVDPSVLDLVALTTSGQEHEYPDIVGRAVIGVLRAEGLLDRVQRVADVFRDEAERWRMAAVPLHVRRMYTAVGHHLVEDVSADAGVAMVSRPVRFGAGLPLRSDVATSLPGVLRVPAAGLLGGVVPTADVVALASWLAETTAGRVQANEPQRIPVVQVSGGDADQAGAVRELLRQAVTGQLRGLGVAPVEVARLSDGMFAGPLYAGQGDAGEVLAEVLDRPVPLVAGFGHSAATSVLPVGASPAQVALALTRIGARRVTGRKAMPAPSEIGVSVAEWGRGQAARISRPVPAQKELLDEAVQQFGGNVITAEYAAMMALQAVEDSSPPRRHLLPVARLRQAVDASRGRSPVALMTDLATELYPNGVTAAEPDDGTTSDTVPVAVNPVLAAIVPGFSWARIRSLADLAVEVSSLGQTVSGDRLATQTGRVTAGVRLAVVGLQMPDGHDEYVGLAGTEVGVYWVDPSSYQLHRVGDVPEQVRRASAAWAVLIDADGRMQPAGNAIWTAAPVSAGVATMPVAETIEARLGGGVLNVINNMVNTVDAGDRARLASANNFGQEVARHYLAAAPDAVEDSWRFTTIVELMTLLHVRLADALLAQVNPGAATASTMALLIEQPMIALWDAAGPALQDFLAQHRLEIRRLFTESFEQISPHFAADLSAERNVPADAPFDIWAVMILDPYGVPYTTTDALAIELLEPDPATLASNSQVLHTIRPGSSDGPHTGNRPAPLALIISGHDPEYGAPIGVGGSGDITTSGNRTQDRTLSEPHAGTTERMALRRTRSSRPPTANGAAFARRLQQVTNPVLRDLLFRHSPALRQMYAPVPRASIMVFMQRGAVPQSRSSGGSPTEAAQVRRVVGSAMAPGAPADWSVMLERLRAAARDDEGATSPLYDPFGWLMPPERPSFMERIDLRALDSAQIVGLLRILDLRNARNTPARITAADIPHDPESVSVWDASDVSWASPDSDLPEDLRRLPVQQEMPHVIHAVWIGGAMSGDSLIKVKFRKHFAKTVRATRHRMTSVFWTDITRAKIKEALDAQADDSLPPEGHPLSGIVDMVKWAVENDIIVLNPWEFLNLDGPGSEFLRYVLLELAKQQPRGFVAASDILRLVILLVFGGLYVDGSNKVETDGSGMVDFVSLIDQARQLGFAVSNDLKGENLGDNRYNNDTIFATRGHPFILTYLRQIVANYSLNQQRLRPDVTTIQTKAGNREWFRNAKLRYSVAARTGPATLGDLAISLGRFPILRGWQDPTVTSWIPDFSAPPTKEALTESAAQHVLEGILTTLIHNLRTNRPGNLHLTLVREAIEKLPNADDAWRIIVKYFHQHPDLRQVVRTVTTEEFSFNSDTRRNELRPLSLPPDVAGLFWLDPENENRAGEWWWLGENMRPINMAHWQGLPATVESPQVDSGAGPAEMPSLANPSEVSVHLVNFLRVRLGYAQLNPILAAITTDRSLDAEINIMGPKDDAESSVKDLANHAGRSPVRMSGYDAVTAAVWLAPVRTRGVTIVVESSGRPYFFNVTRRDGGVVYWDAYGGKHNQLPSNPAEVWLLPTSENFDPPQDQSVAALPSILDTIKFLPGAPEQASMSTTEPEAAGNSRLDGGRAPESWREPGSPTISGDGPQTDAVAGSSRPAEQGHGTSGPRPASEHAHQVAVPLSANPQQSRSRESGLVSRGPLVGDEVVMTQATPPGYQLSSELDVLVLSQPGWLVPAGVAHIRPWQGGGAVLVAAVSPDLAPAALAEALFFAVNGVFLGEAPPLLLLVAGTGEDNPVAARLARLLEDNWVNAEIVAPLGEWGVTGDGHLAETLSSQRGWRRFRGHNASGPVDGLVAVNAEGKGEKPVADGSAEQRLKDWMRGVLREPDRNVMQRMEQIRKAYYGGSSSAVADFERAAGSSWRNVSQSAVVWQLIQTGSGSTAFVTRDGQPQVWRHDEGGVYLISPADGRVRWVSVSEAASTFEVDAIVLDRNGQPAPPVSAPQWWNAMNGSARLDVSRGQNGSTIFWVGAGLVFADGETIPPLVADIASESQQLTLVVAAGPGTIVNDLAHEITARLHQLYRPGSIPSLRLLSREQDGREVLAKRLRELLPGAPIVTREIAGHRLHEASRVASGTSPHVPVYAVGVPDQSGVLAGLGVSESVLAQLPVNEFRVGLGGQLLAAFRVGATDFSSSGGVAVRQVPGQLRMAVQWWLRTRRRAGSSLEGLFTAVDALGERGGDGGLLSVEAKAVILAGVFTWLSADPTGGSNASRKMLEQLGTLREAVAGRVLVGGNVAAGAGKVSEHIEVLLSELSEAARRPVSTGESAVVTGNAPVEPMLVRQAIALVGPVMAGARVGGEGSDVVKSVGAAIIRRFIGFVKSGPLADSMDVVDFVADVEARRIDAVSKPRSWREVEALLDWAGDGGVLFETSRAGVAVMVAPRVDGAKRMRVWRVEQTADRVRTTSWLAGEDPGRVVPAGVIAFNKCAQLVMLDRR
jgi:hypothetical protein